MENESPDKKPTVAYVPFKTLLNSIESLEHGLPNTIDRSVWPSFSGVMQSQVLGAFRFLGLIKSDGTPTPDLQKLVEDKANRKVHLRKVLERSYPNLIKADLTKMSMGNFENAMRTYDISGETLRKAASFFLQAARYTDIPLSPYILKQTRNVSGTRKRRTQPPTHKSPSFLETFNAMADNGITQAGPTKTITLQNGATVSLRASSDLFNMTAADRKFLLGLLEEMEAYEKVMKDGEGK